MRLYEFQSDVSLTLKNVVTVLSRTFHLEQVGGPTRFYTVGDKKAAIFVLGSSVKAIGIAWSSNIVSQIYIWNKFNPFSEPDFVLDLPEGNFQDMISSVTEWIKHPTTGKISENSVSEDIDDTDGRGAIKVTYVYPDGKNIGNDRFENKTEAESFAEFLHRKGYTDIGITYAGRDIPLGESSVIPGKHRKIGTYSDKNGSRFKLHRDINDPSAHVFSDMDGNIRDEWHGATNKVHNYLTNRMGLNLVSEDLEEDAVLDEAKRTTAADFMAMAQRMFGDKSAKLSIVDLNKIAQDNDVQIPSEIRQSREYKVDAHNWNLSGKSSDNAEETNNELSKAVGAPVENEPEMLDPAYQDALRLAKAKTVSRMASQGKVYLMGRKVNGAFFRIQGFDEYAAQMERLLSREITKAGGDNRASMEQQYSDMQDKVKLVAGGGSTFLKSLLITGGPSSGKTFNVMQTVKQLGLVEGRDYVVKKGRITALSMYRTLIEQIDGMVIFDDCDSVVEDKNGINMLKGALDTDPVRELSYDVRGTLNTAVMSPELRDSTVDSISRILRGKPIGNDLQRFEHFLKKKKKGAEDMEDDDDDLSQYDTEDFGDDDEEGDFDHDKLHELQQYFTRHLPNKIDFRGRIIFISNMPESDWDSAILTRAFTINMDFSSQEMLDYIDKIKGHIKTPGLSDEEKQEVVDYVRELYTTGKLKRQINFRLIQQCFDLRLVDSWRRLIGML